METIRSDRLSGTNLESSRYLETIRFNVTTHRDLAAHILSTEINRIDQQKVPDAFFKDAESKKSAVFRAVMEALDQRSQLRQEWIHKQKAHAIDQIGKAA